MLFDKPRTFEERIRDSGGFRHFPVVATSDSISIIDEMRLLEFTTLPEDDRWVNVILHEKEEEVEGAFRRLGVGQVSKVGWEWAEPVLRSIKLD